jgi:hypothetical protein
MKKGRQRVSLLGTLTWAGFVAVGGCSLIDPKVGPAQASCAAAGQSSGGYSYGGATSSSGADDSCPLDAGNACDDCESLHCCDTRRACYGDAVCGCADQALDTCLDSADDDASADASQASARCWDAFSATGHIAQARVSCQRMFCQVECAVP